MPDPAQYNPSPPKEGVIQLKLFDADFSFKFPNQGNTVTHLQKILNGKVYPNLRGLGIKPTRIIDIGANLGASAVLFHSQYPEAAIDCFEPNAANLEWLRANLATLPNVTLHPYGLFNEDKETTLFHGRNQALQGSIFTSAEVTTEGESIQLKDAREALTDCIETDTLIKIDTEGCELPILERLTSAFDQLKIIYLEFHSEQDRIAIDALLAPTHGLFHAAILNPHRGDLCYLHRSLWETHPTIAAQRVS